MVSVDPAKLKVGLNIPNGDGPMTPTAFHWSDILQFAVAAENAGLDSVWVADHMIFDFPDTPIQGRWECWTLLSAIAQATQRVEIGPLVACAGFRNPGLMAKMAETLDEVSGGRLILGLGAGWHEPEFTTYGFPYDHRASRFEEQFHVIHNLIRHGYVDYSGDYASAPNCYLRPRGPRNGQLPIMVGTDGPRMLQLAARHADIWNTTWTRSVDEVLPRLAALDAACDNTGRDRQSIGRSCCVFIDLPGAVGVWLNGNVSQPKPMSTEETAQLLADYAAHGVDHVMVWPDPFTVGAIEQVGEAIRLLRS